MSNKEVNRDEITWAENEFKKHLLIRLNSRGVECEVGHNQFLPVPVSMFPKNSEKDKRRGSYGYQLIRPDFLILNFCIVIEIDGPIHEVDAVKAGKDCVRERVLSSLGITTLRIPNSVLNDYRLGNPRELNRYFEILFKLIRSRQGESFKAQRAKTKKKVLGLRRRFREFEPKLISELGRHSYPKFKHIRSARKYGGYVYWVDKK